MYRYFYCRINYFLQENDFVLSDGKSRLLSITAQLIRESFGKASQRSFG